MQTNQRPNYVKILLLAGLIVLPLFILTAKTEVGSAKTDVITSAESANKSESTAPAAESVVEVITDDTPLNIPDSLKTYFKSKQINSVILGDESGRIRLLTSTGEFINPCSSKAKAANQTVKQNSPVIDSVCRLEGDLAEINMLIMSRSGGPRLEGANRCGTCQVNNVNRVCNLDSNAYGCRRQRNSCSEVACEE